MAKKNLPAKVEGGLPAAPDYLEQGRDGLENMRPQDLLVPRLILMQALSPAVVDKNVDADAGDMFNSMTMERWVAEGDLAEFIPVFHYLEWIKWGSRDEGEGILGRSRDPKSDLAISAARREQNEKGRPIVTEYHNFVCLFPELGMDHPVVIGCAKTNHSRGRHLLGLACYRGNYPLYSGKYTVEAEQRTNVKGTFYVFKFANAGWASKEEFAFAKEFSENIKGRDVVAHDPGSEEESAEEKDF